MAQEAPAKPAPSFGIAPLDPNDMAPSKEQVTKLFETMHLHDQVQSMMKMLPATIQQQLQKQSNEMLSELPGGGKATPEQREAAAKATARVMEKGMNLFTADELIASLTAAYQHHLTRSDVDALIAFYSTPAGQHFLSKQPEVMQEYMETVMGNMGERVKRLNAELRKEMQECMKPSGSAAPIVPPPPASAAQPK